MEKILMCLFEFFLLFSALIPSSNTGVYNKKILDTGIYWFGKGDVMEKSIDGITNSYFNPSKPTMIYIHGWEPNSTTHLQRETFNLHDDNYSSPNLNLADFWIDNGWNVGIFYWDQLSDELDVTDAEAKLWTASGPQKMRWKKADGSYDTSNTPDISVCELFVQTYFSAMKDFSGSEIRLCGHSLGSQAVINSCKLISDEIDNGLLSEKLLPNRITLLDPFFSTGEKSYLNNKWTGEVCREYVNYLKEKNVVFEEYKSSNLSEFGIGDSNEEMQNLTAFIDLHPDYTGLFNQNDRHSASKYLYFYSMAFNPPKEIKDGIFTGKNAGYASTSTNRIREMMNQKNKWNQKGGCKTNTPKDDTFNIVSK